MFLLYLVQTTNKKYLSSFFLLKMTSLKKGVHLSLEELLSYLFCLFGYYIDSALNELTKESFLLNRSKGIKVHLLFSPVPPPPSLPPKSQTLVLVSPVSFQIRQLIYCETSDALASGFLPYLLRTLPGP